MFYFRANGEQEQGNDTSCLYVALLCSLQKWDSWLCSLSLEVKVKQRPRNP